MEIGWVIVYSTADEYLGTVAKELLQENDIESVMMNHKDSAYAFMGEVEIYVSEENEKQAVKILEQLKIG